MKGQGFSGEILHFGVARLRVVGAGNLLLYLRSLDNVEWDSLPTIAMSTATNREPTVLANFNDQRAQLEVKVTVLNEVFNISKMTLFVKPVASGYPQ